MNKTSLVLFIIFHLAILNTWTRISTTCFVLMTSIMLSNINIDDIILSKSIVIFGILRSFLTAHRKSASINGKILEIPYVYAETEYMLRVPYSSSHRSKVSRYSVKIYRGNSIEIWNQQYGLPFMCSANELQADKIEIYDLEQEEIKQVYTVDERIIFNF